MNCSICLEAFTATLPTLPRTLAQCGHTFCHDCLGAVLDAQGDIRCPTCRAITRVPGGDVSNLNKAFALLQLMEAMGNNNPNQNQQNQSSSHNDGKQETDASLDQHDYKDADCNMTAAYVDNLSDSGTTSCITIQPPKSNGKRVPMDICIVIDISGSMSSIAEIQNESGQVESDGLSLLDIVVHAAKTIVNTMTANDRVAIVSYNHEAKLEFPLTGMDDARKQGAKRALSRLRPTGRTDLWRGLKVALDTLKDNQGSGVGRTSTVFLLTDGIPNVEPPRGHIPTLTRYMQQHQVKSAIHTFGFGYKMDSPLLTQIASLGRGSYIFIPDASFVGTSFVNACSNALTTYANDAVMKIKALDAKAFDTGNKSLVVGTLPSQVIAADEVVIKVGPLQFGQSRSVVLNLATNNPRLEVSLTYTNLQDGAPSVCYLNSTDVPPEVDGKTQVGAEWARCIATAALSEALARGGNRLAISQKMLAKTISRISECYANTDSRVEALLEDLEGQCTEALSRSDWFEKWGCHYLPSLCGAHVHQRCNNFKDPGVQHYGGVLFGRLRDEADDIFISMPAPVPTQRQPQAHHHSARFRGRGRGGRRASRSPVRREQKAVAVSMNRYHNSRNICFTGDAQVLCYDPPHHPTKRYDNTGSWESIMSFAVRKSLKDIRRGQQVVVFENANPDSASIARVRCVVKTQCVLGTSDLVEINSSTSSNASTYSLFCTPWHPIREPNCTEWKFPFDMVLDEAPFTALQADFHSGAECSAVYNLLLSADDMKLGAAHIIDVNGFQAVTLGHGIQNHPVTAHPYFGSMKHIQQDLQSMVGWEDGMVVLQSGSCVVKDYFTGLVTQIVQR